MSQHFGSRLQSEIIEEWKDHYVNYKPLKQLVQKVEELRKQQAPQINNTSSQKQQTDMVKKIGDQLEEGILRSDKFFCKAFEELHQKMSCIYEVNSDILDGVPLNEHGASFAASIILGQTGSFAVAKKRSTGLDEDGLSRNVSPATYELDSDDPASRLLAQGSSNNNQQHPSGVNYVTPSSPPQNQANPRTNTAGSVSMKNVLATGTTRTPGVPVVTRPVVANKDGIFHYQAQQGIGGGMKLRRTATAGSLAGGGVGAAGRTLTGSPMFNGNKNASLNDASKFPAFPSTPAEYMQSKDKKTSCVAAAAAASGSGDNNNLSQDEPIVPPSLRKFAAKNIKKQEDENTTNNLNSNDDGSSPMKSQNTLSYASPTDQNEEAAQQQQQQQETDDKRYTSELEDNAFSPLGRNSTAPSVFDAVLRSSHKGKVHDQGTNPLIEDVQLSILVEIYQGLVKLYRFVELNHLSTQRLWRKYEKYVIKPFNPLEWTKANSNNNAAPIIEHYGSTADTDTNDNNNEFNNSNPFVAGGKRVKNLVDTSPLRERLIQCEKFIERVREVAEKIYGKEIIERHFVASVTTAQDKRYWTIKWKYAVLAFVVMFILLAVPLFPNNDQGHNCLAMLACIVVLWVSEAIPFFTTAMLIPLLAVPLAVLPNKSHQKIGETLLAATFDHVQILVLGGLCMGKALAKHKMELYIARLILRPIAHRPRLFVLVLMLVSALVCTALSNVAAPVLVLNVIQPTLWRMNRNSGGPQCILLALAISSNLGGYLGPIASPQNAVALKALGSDSISFTEWVGGALPIVVVEIFIAWGLLLYIWKPFPKDYVLPVSSGQDATAGAQIVEDEVIEQQDELAAALLKKSGVNSYNPEALMTEKVEKVVVLMTCFITVLLWCLPMEPLFGDAGVVALLPIVVFFGLGVLNKDDFNGLSWHLLFLLAGGNMLGVCTKESGLLTDIVHSIRPFLENNPPYVVLVVLILFVSVITTFVSHTVSSLLLSPVIVEIASVNPALPSAKTLVFLNTLMMSASMTFPISSFPNVNSLLAEDEQARPYLEPKDFLLPGGIMTVVGILQLISYMVPFAEFMFPRAD